MLKQLIAKHNRQVVASLSSQALKAATPFAAQHNVTRNMATVAAPILNPAQLALKNPNAKDDEVDGWDARAVFKQTVIPGADTAISPLGHFGWYPLVGLGVTTLISKELIMVDDALYAWFNFIACGSVIYIAVADKLGNLLVEDHVKENDQMISAARLRTKMIKKSIDVEDKWFAQAKVLKDYNVLYQKACADIQVALGLKTQHELRDYIEGMLKRAQAKENEVAASASKELEADLYQYFTNMFTEEHPDQEFSQKVIDESIEKAIVYLGQLSGATPTPTFVASDPSTHPTIPSQHVRQLFTDVIAQFQAGKTPEGFGDKYEYEVVPVDYTKVPEELSHPPEETDLYVAVSGEITGTLTEEQASVFMDTMLNNIPENVYNEHGIGSFYYMDAHGLMNEDLIEPDRIKKEKD